MTFYGWLGSEEIEHLERTYAELKKFKNAPKYLIHVARLSNHISLRQLKEMYIDNLNIRLEYVDSLVENIDGKTVVTGDHRELLGACQSPPFESWKFRTIFTSS